MADRSKKDSTPPPLLLMPAGGGLTLNPSAGSNLLMPVAQSEASLFSPEEEGEADSFVGQGPPTQPPGGPGAYFQSPPHGGASDPFSQVHQPGPGVVGTPQHQTPFSTPQQQTPFSTPPTGPSPPFGVNTSSAGLQGPPGQPGPPGPPMGLPPGAATPPRGPPNLHRIQGPPRYAQPPPGTYGPTSDPNMSLGPSPSSVGLPPASIGSSQTSVGIPPSSIGIGSPPSQNMPPMGAPPSAFNPIGSPPGTAQGPPPTLPVTSPGLIPGGYTPVQHHWCYCTSVELKAIWHPMSLRDSGQLEEAFRTGVPPNTFLNVEGGRYDVDVAQRSRRAVYWEEDPTIIRRCSWFYKNEGDNRYVPYEEPFAERLEDEYRNAVLNNIWHKRLEFPGGETIVMHNPNVIVHFSSASQPDEWGTTQVGRLQGDATRPKVVKRGIVDFDYIDEGEPQQVDHVVFIVHGIGSTCDLRFRNIVECGEPLKVDHVVFVVHGIGTETEYWTKGIVLSVNDFRLISFQILKSHFGHYQSEGRIGRVEFLPVKWHAALHGDATGIDKRLKAITLKSIGKLRHFTNDTLLDILFYASPAYCQKIADTVNSEVSRLYHLFLTRNPDFKGTMSVAGHSLGSLILFDLLSHQKDQENPTPEQNGTPEPASKEGTPVSDTQEGYVHELTNGVHEEEEIAEEEEDEELTLDLLLERLGLGDFTDTFKKEQIDMESLSLCDEADIKEMGIPMGPRKKLQGYFKERKQRQTHKKERANRKAQEALEQKARELALQQAREQEQQNSHQAAVHDPLLKSASSTSVNYVVGGNGTGLPQVTYPSLPFRPAHFFALGSPIAMFLTVRGVDMLGEEFRLPTCSGFFNIFHPFDPVAYRMEPLVSQSFPVKPVLMPHHKGRKRMHLELKESLTRMGADIKQKIIDSLKGTWATINQFAQAHRASPQEMVDQEVNSVLSQMSKEEDDRAETGSVASSMPEDDLPIGQLNQGRRIDFVLQEKPIESFNDYLFALGSHACYWESEDTVLMILKEIYAMMGVAPIRPGQDKQLASPQRLPYLPSPGSPPGGFTPPVGSTSAPGLVSPPGVQMPPPPMSYGQAPTPPTSNAPPTNYGPPPLSGFVRK